MPCWVVSQGWASWRTRGPDLPSAGKRVGCSHWLLTGVVPSNVTVCMPSLDHCMLCIAPLLCQDVAVQTGVHVMLYELWGLELTGIPQGVYMASLL